jgi:MtN3 and saliva related transmembrane protein
MGELLHPWTETIGFWAALLTTIAFVPQLFKTWRSDEDGMSWWMLALFGAGVGLWFVYGLLRMSGPVMLANGVTGLEVVAIVGLKGWRRSNSRLRRGGSSRGAS